jgi:hypothetical protein
MADIRQVMIDVRAVSFIASTAHLQRILTSEPII